MIQTEIYEGFSAWLDDLLENNDMPGETAAFNFNLYEESEDSSEHIYGIQLIAADRFEEEDGEWACYEAWTSGEDIFCIDTSDEPDTGTQHAMELISEMVSEYLGSGKYREILTGTRAVGIGFVDGDIELLYKAD
ncbi:MAG TPA: hypothetical protein DCZ71_00020 [Ruminococcus sp.]|nr:hypothetical protein [Ruminococcus sp.]